MVEYGAVLQIRDVYSRSQILIVFFHSRSWIPHLGSGIPDLKTGGWEEQIICLTFLRSHKFLKIKNYFVFE